MRAVTCAWSHRRCGRCAAHALHGGAARFRSGPFSRGFLLVAADYACGDVREALIVGDAADPRTRALVRELAPLTDARVLTARLPASGASDELAALFPTFEGKKALRGEPTAFLCKRGACEAPTSDPAALRRALAAR